MYPCPSCNTTIQTNNRRGKLIACPRCHERFIFEFFPALTAPAATSAAGAVLGGDESSCFYHTDKVAVQSCSYCGRFLCALCEVPVDGKHLCPMCLAKGKDALSTSSTLQNHALHDSIALIMGCAALLIFPFSPLTGPLTFFLIFKNYRKSLGLIPRMRWRFWVAGLLALAGMSVSGFFYMSLFTMS